MCGPEDPFLGLFCSSQDPRLPSADWFRHKSFHKTVNTPGQLKGNPASVFSKTIRSFTKIRTSSKIIRIYWKVHKNPFKTRGQPALCLGCNIILKEVRKLWPCKCRKMGPFSNRICTQNWPGIGILKLYAQTLHLSSFHMSDILPKKCFYFMIFYCNQLKLSVSKNWYLFFKF